MITTATPGPARPIITPIVTCGYWPTLIVACTGLLVALYHLAVPAHGPWRRDLPGAVLAMLGWLAGSYLLRTYLTYAIAHSPMYGVLSPPLPRCSSSTDRTRRAPRRRIQRPNRPPEPHPHHGRGRRKAAHITRNGTSPDTDHQSDRGRPPHG